MEMRSALIVGVGSGLSASLARLFAKNGLQVALASRNPDRLAALAQRDRGGDLRLRGGRARGGRRPVRRGDRHAGRAGRGGLQRQRPVRADRSPNSIPRRWRARSRSAPMRGFLVGQQAARHMLPRGSGAILFTGASASVKGYPLSAPFAMGKFALRGLAQSMARELAPQGIHVAHFVIDGGDPQSRADASRRTSRTACSIPMRSPRATGTWCSSRAAPGPGRWNCGPGSSGSEVRWTAGSSLSSGSAASC